jgi:hypothetical protein
MQFRWFAARGAAVDKMATAVQEAECVLRFNSVKLVQWLRTKRSSERIGLLYAWHKRICKTGWLCTAERTFWVRIRSKGCVSPSSEGHSRQGMHTSNVSQRQIKLKSSCTSMYMKVRVYYFHPMIHNILLKRYKSFLLALYLESWPNQLLSTNTLSFIHDFWENRGRTVHIPPSYLAVLRFESRPRYQLRPTRGCFTHTAKANVETSRNTPISLFSICLPLTIFSPF